jgi:hypothetical protein
MAAYRDERLAAGKSSITANNELILISHLFSAARKEWGMESLQNPVSNVRKPRLPPGPDRRLAGDEEQRLLEHAEYSMHELIVLVTIPLSFVGPILGLLHLGHLLRLPRDARAWPGRSSTTALSSSTGSTRSSRRAGDPGEVIIDAAITRLRLIFMATLTRVLSLPIIVSRDALFFSVPVLYAPLLRIREAPLEDHISPVSRTPLSVHGSPSISSVVNGR